MASPLPLLPLEECYLYLSQALDTVERGELQTYVTSVRMGWQGVNADEAFAALSKCANLKYLDIVVGREALKHKTEGEEKRRAFFPHAKSRIFDALGMDELLCLRGLARVSIQNPAGIGIHNPTNPSVIIHNLADPNHRHLPAKEFEGLNALLQATLLLPRSS